MQPTTPPRRIRTGPCALILAVGSTLAASPGASAATQDAGDDPMEAVRLSEKVILSLTPDLKKLGASVLDLELPSGDARKLFEERVLVADVAAPPAGHARALMEGEIYRTSWTVAAARTVGRDDLDLWRDFIDGVDYFEHAKFKIVRGHALGTRQEGFETHVLFAALGRTAAGGLVHASAHVNIVWGGYRGKDRTVGLIRGWETEDFTCTAVPGPAFEDVLESALPDHALRRRARRSIHEEIIVKLYRDKDQAPRWFTSAAWDRHPGLSVVDVDRDGLDDLYLMERWGRNMLLRNRGDGTFADVAPELGLDLEDHCSSAIFADFDNDGDADVIVGRTLGPSRYLVQENGRFVDRAGWIDGALPHLVSSVSAADYDGDGLLDVYLSTYAAAMIQDELNVSTIGGVTEESLERAGDRLLAEFLSEDDSRKLRSVYESRGHPILDRPGPPNVLLHNEGGGRFRVVGGDHPLRAWRNTYQSTWADYDGDGDPDVYLANDFAPNMLCRNDGGGAFTDVTEETGTADIGFGMGASFGDYDNDGRQDLYVSNMFSKAGRRITAQVEGLDPRFAWMARGNSLFHNQEPRFERVSGLEPPALLVEAGGWAWGGQFLDFDNDGLLDVCSPSGYYTAPDEIAIPVDT